MKISKIPTGISGLDDILYGGIPELATVIIAGSPGSGKTTLATQMAFNLAKSGKKILYLTTISESKMKMIRNLSAYSFFDHKLLEDKVVFVDISRAIYEKSVESISKEIDRLVREHVPDLLIIDSIKAIRDLLGSEERMRDFVFKFSMILPVWEITTFIVGEYLEKDVSTFPEFAIADGIIYLYGQEEPRFQRRFLRILKMRGSSYKEGQHLFKITEDGIRVYPRVKQKFEMREIASGSRPFGIQKFDELISGGVYIGSVLLIAGATGTGKTLLSLHFAYEGAKRGEKSVYVGFEEDKAHLIATAHDVGLSDFGKFVEEGKIKILSISPVELDPDYFAVWLMEECDGASRLVIDSLSSFVLAVDSARKYRDFIWALRELVKSKGMSAVFTVESGNPFRERQSLEGDVSLISDDVVMLQFVEKSGKLERVLSILKGRRKQVDTSMWVYDIGKDGVKFLRKWKE
jgi:circadian clock protein KaiC